MMKVGFTGTREGMTDAQKDAFGQHFRRLTPTEFHHGACVGADADAVDIAADSLVLGLTIVAHPSNLPGLTDDGAMRESDERLCPKPPLERNRDIVDACEVLVACPKGEEEQRSGTWATIRYARKLRKKVVICWPDGQVTEEN